MSDDTTINELTHEIRRIYRSNPPQAETAIDTFLTKTLAALPDNEKKRLLTTLAFRFESQPFDTTPKRFTDESVFNGIFSLLLGRQVSTEKLSTPEMPEMMERLSESLNTIFTTLNRLIQNINATLLGGNTGEQTIRHLIGSGLEGQEQQISLEAYLGRIDKAFFIFHQSFKQAAHTLVLKLLREIDPENIAAEVGKGLKFGPLKKAEYYDIYETRYSTIIKWFESGRFMEDLLREFENNCQLNH